MARGEISYPESQRYRGGGKVSWHYYSKETDAQTASKAAIANARQLAEEGYDFGYCSPGSIRKIAEDNYEVCIP